MLVESSLNIKFHAWHRRCLLCDLQPLKMQWPCRGNEWARCHDVPQLVRSRVKADTIQTEKYDDEQQKHGSHQWQGLLSFIRCKRYGALPSLPWDHRCQRGGGRSQRWWRKQRLWSEKSHRQTNRYAFNILLPQWFIFWRQHTQSKSKMQIKPCHLVCLVIISVIFFATLGDSSSSQSVTATRSNQTATKCSLALLLTFYLIEN